MRKPLPGSASKSALKLRQKVIPIVSDSNKDTKEEVTRVSDLEISNDDEKRVVNPGTKKRPPERDLEIWCRIILYGTWGSIIFAYKSHHMTILSQLMVA